MTTPEVVTLVLAVLGVLHGPLVPALLRRWRRKASTK